jgi:dipeptidase E
VHSQTRGFYATGLSAIGACVFLLVAMPLPSTRATLHSEITKPDAKRQIFALGGGGLEKTNGVPLLMKYFLGLTGKEKPRVCFMPSASGDSAADINRWNEVMKGLECQPRVQKVYIASPKVKSFETELFQADAIYIGGGNGLNMLAMWKAQGIDKILRQAYDRGIVLGGEGAGAICWFEQGSSDSRPAKLTVLDCLGFLKGSNCPDYGGHKDRRPLYQEWITKGEIKEGLALDSGVGLHFVDEKLLKAITTNAQAKAYQVTRDGDKAFETTLKAELLVK